jgi:hypothetical protein
MRGRHAGPPTRITDRSSYRISDAVTDRTMPFLRDHRLEDEDDDEYEDDLALQAEGLDSGGQSCRFHTEQFCGASRAGYFAVCLL